MTTRPEDNQNAGDGVVKIDPKDESKTFECECGEFEKGDRVLVKGKRGTVAYKVMAPPHYVTVKSYSVVLDERRKDPGYVGSMYIAEDVAKLRDAT